MAEGKVLIVCTIVDNNLECPGIEGIDEYPYTNHCRQVQSHTVQIVQNVSIVNGHGAQHHNDGHDAEDQEYVSE